MKIVILGGAGFIGQKLAADLMSQKTLSIDGKPPSLIEQIILFDQKEVSPLLLEDDRVTMVRGDLADMELMRRVFLERPDVVFHLAAIVSGQAEKEFELGMNINLHANLDLLELFRSMEYQPVIVFASTCGVFGGDLSYIIRDDSAPTPRSSYGTQKAMMELLLNDYSRRNFIDARILRLPTIIVRPGKPNAATSSFASSIIREPLNGKKTICPVEKETKIWVLSPRKAVRNFVHAVSISSDLLGINRIITLPGMTTSVRQLVEALIEKKGQKIAELIEWRPDPFIQSIVMTWPPHFNPERALSLGFESDGSADEIIEAYISEELDTAGP